MNLSVKNMKSQWGLNFLLVLAGLFIGLCFFEVVLRVFSLGRITTEPRFFYSQNSELGWTITQNFKGNFYTSEFNTPVEINSEGLRDFEHSFEKPAGTYRILGLGDSFTFGYGVNFEATYLRLLEEQLNADGKKNFEIIKTGVPGYSLRQEALFFETKAIRYQPDMVTVGFDVNDHVDSLVPYFQIFDGFMVRNETIKKPFFRARFFLTTHFRSLHLLFKAFQMLEDYFWRGTDEFHLKDEKLKKEFKEKALQFVDQKLGEMQRLCKERGIRLVVFYIPHRSQVHPDKFKKQPFAYFFEDLDKRLEQICEKYQIDYINLMPELIAKAKTGKMLHFNMDGHWNEEGHKTAAAFLYEKLTPLILAEKR